MQNNYTVTNKNVMKTLQSGLILYRRTNKNIELNDQRSLRFEIITIPVINEKFSYEPPKHQYPLWISLVGA